MSVIEDKFDRWKQHEETAEAMIPIVGKVCTARRTSRSCSTAARW
ncbi:hypothetical protein [Nocardioides convexus]|nr:hypothetical protein [Nocardioides convexus]